jgi:hypothetical protein
LKIEGEDGRIGGCQEGGMQASCSTPECCKKDFRNSMVMGIAMLMNTMEGP